MHHLHFCNGLLDAWFMYKLPQWMLIVAAQAALNSELALLSAEHWI